MIRMLADVLPSEALSSEYEGCAFRRLLGARVVREASEKWPGPHKNVGSKWWALEGGYAVGWNENPARGWSFPVVRLNKTTE